MNNQILKGAIFDLDGTVMDSNGAWDGCGLAVLEKWGYQPKPTLVEDLFPLGAGDIVRFLKQEYAMTQSLEEIYQAMLDYMRQVYAEQVQLKSGVREVLLQLTMQHQLHYHWVKGHADNPKNNRCDQLAVAESQKYK